MTPNHNPRRETQSERPLTFSEFKEACEVIVIWIAVAVAATALLVALGSRRVGLGRRVSIEAIESEDAAAAYERINQWPQFRLLRRMILARMARYRPGGVLTDIGCGPGRLLFLIADRFKELKVIGIDASKEMIELAEKKALERDKAGRIEFRIGDVGKLPLESATVDFAVSTLSLHHWSNTNSGLSEIHRVLRPGGQMLLFDLRRDARRFFYWLLVFAQSVVVPFALRRINEPIGSLLASYSFEELHHLMERAPFKEWKVIGKAAWAYTWGRKEESRAVQHP